MSRQIQAALLRGDPGILSIALGAGKLIAKGAGAIVKKVANVIKKPGVVGTTGTAVVKSAGTTVGSKVGTAVGAAVTGASLASLFTGRSSGARVGGRRMNPLNMRALKRAIRRQDRFVDAARMGLKGTKFTVATRGAGKHHHGHGCKCSTCK